MADQSTPIEDERTSIGYRLKEERERLGLSRVDLASRGGVTEKTQGMYERGERAPDAVYLAGVKRAGVDVDFVLDAVTQYRKLPVEVADASIDPSEPKVIRGSHLAQAGPDGFTLIPVYNVKVSAGGGALNHHAEVVQHLAFRTDWVAGTLDRDPAQLVVVEVAGDSMAPTLNENDTLLVDRTEHQLTDGIYVLDINDRMMVKRIQVLADGSIRLKSDNSAYSTEDIRDQELEQLVVVGRVVWIGRRV